MNQEEGFYQTLSLLEPLILYFQLLELGEKNICCLRHSVQGTFVIGAQVGQSVLGIILVSLHQEVIPGLKGVNLHNVWNSAGAG